MPTFLSDPPLLGLFTLGILCLIAGGLWVRYRLLPLLIAAVLLVVLIIVWMVLGLMSESPREESVRRVSELAAAVTEKNWAKFSENVSESFGDGKIKKVDLKTGFDFAGRENVRVVAWDFALTDPPRVTDTEVVISFEAKASPPTGEPFLRRIEATFGKDPDGKFRLRAYKAFLPGSKTEAPIPFTGR